MRPPEGRDDDRNRRGDDSVIRAGVADRPVASTPRVRASHWPLIGLVGTLLVIFVGVTWFINGLVREALGGIPAPVAAIGLQPRSAPPPDTPARGAVCAMTYADPMQTARILMKHRSAQRTRDPVDLPHGTILIDLTHRLSSGRLVVLVDGRTALSKPFATGPGETTGTVLHRLSVPAGSHRVRVRLLGEHDGFDIEARTDGMVTSGQVARLRVKQPGGAPDALYLEWASAGEAGGR